MINLSKEEFYQKLYDLLDTEKQTSGTLARRNTNDQICYCVEGLFALVLGYELVFSDVENIAIGMTPKVPNSAGDTPIYYDELYPCECFPNYFPINVSVKFLYNTRHPYFSQTGEKYFSWWELNDKLGLNFQQFKVLLQLVEHTPKEEVEYNFVDNQVGLR